jgi:hypothetical protein
MMFYLKKSLVTEENFQCVWKMVEKFNMEIKEKAAKKKLMTFSVCWCSTFHFKSKKTPTIDDYSTFVSWYSCYFF